MRTHRLCVCLLISGMLFIVGGCHKAAHFAPPQDHDVSINNCGASPETVTVRERDGVVWHADNHDYAIRFKNQSEPAPNPIHVPHGGSQREPIKGHSGCDQVGPGEFYCKYSLTKDNDPSPCADPGIRIIP